MEFFNYGLQSDAFHGLPDRIFYFLIRILQYKSNIFRYRTFSVFTGMNPDQRRKPHWFHRIINHIQSNFRSFLNNNCPSSTNRHRNHHCIFQCTKYISNYDRITSGALCQQCTCHSGSSFCFIYKNQTVYCH